MFEPVKEKVAAAKSAVLGSGLVLSQAMELEDDEVGVCHSALEWMSLQQQRRLRNPRSGKIRGRSTNSCSHSRFF